MIETASARINLTALQHNLSTIRQQAPASRLLAVIKANAYGHGLVPIARALDRADGFGVARVEEATTLRDAGIASPILLLEGVTDPSELETLGRHRIDLVVHCEEQLRMLELSDATDAFKVWLKIDTGMHRLGWAADNVADVYQRLTAARSAAGSVVLMTHFADAGDKASATTEEQLSVFCKCARPYDCELSAANSAGLFGCPGSHLDWIRPGLALYGASPFYDDQAGSLGLRPVMTFQTGLIAVKSVPAGGRVGYGGTWTAQKETRIGIAAVGYGDGYLRALTTDTPVLVNGQRTRTLGCNSMDMMAIDLSDVAAAKIGDPVVLWGERLPVEEVSAHGGTIPYELLANVAERVKREYVSDS